MYTMLKEVASTPPPTLHLLGLTDYFNTQDFLHNLNTM